VAELPPGTPGPADGEPARPESLLQTARGLWEELRGTVSDRVELLTLELQRAAGALTQIIVLVVAAAILTVTAWLVLWAGIVVTLMALGMHIAGALLMVLAFNVLAVLVAVSRVRKLLPRLSLPATRRHLAPSPATAPPTPLPAEVRAHEHRTDHTPAGQPAAR
jgi:uncharacterized membrane protein YqjE